MDEQLCGAGLPDFTISVDSVTRLCCPRRQVLLEVAALPPLQLSPQWHLVLLREGGGAGHRGHDEGGQGCAPRRQLRRWIAASWCGCCLMSPPHVCAHDNSLYFLDNSSAPTADAASTLPPLRATITVHPRDRGFVVQTCAASS
ncbi:hypothetical protein GWK47_053408 [Chionoecetes opilio]|uniref:Uncharacterized protein n=1 Tax=Chionoecetes opilio TaxID=41210 RepID=A0A8J5C947_CHIOP|nr:hypothetical protein GWK47_053408 [Chionoecetes opilio]